jgi:hypothetical protein
MAIDPSEIAILELADFGVPALISGVTYAGIFSAPARKEALYEGQIETSAPALRMLDTDCASAAVVYNTQLTVLGIQYAVIELEPDGLGMTTLHLTKDF